MKNNSWLDALQKINVSVMVLLSAWILSTLFIGYEETWKFLPVFKFHIFEADKPIEIFVHAYLFDFNLGFYFQLFVLLFSFMIFFSTRRNISFHLMYILVILRSALLLMQDAAPPKNYISATDDHSIELLHVFYISFFGLLFILNMIYDTKKRPRVPEPSDIIKD